jgi:hypothetical protein
MVQFHIVRDDQVPVHIRYTAASAPLATQTPQQSARSMRRARASLTPQTGAGSALREALSNAAPARAAANNDDNYDEDGELGAAGANGYDAASRAALSRARADYDGEDLDSGSDDNQSAAATGARGGGKAKGGGKGKGKGKGLGMGGGMGIGVAAFFCFCFFFFFFFFFFCVPVPSNTCRPHTHTPSNDHTHPYHPNPCAVLARPCFRFRSVTSRGRRCTKKYPRVNNGTTMTVMEMEARLALTTTMLTRMGTISGMRPGAQRLFLRAHRRGAV